MKIRILDRFGIKLDGPGISLEPENQAERDQLARIKEELKATDAYWWEGFDSESGRRVRIGAQFQRQNNNCNKMIHNSVKE